MGDRNHNLIFTYGTLKQGFPNHSLIQVLISSNDAVFIGQRTTLQTLPLVIGPYGIPYLINLPGSGHRVRGELYSVSDIGLKRLDELEGVADGHYQRLAIEIDGCDTGAEAYFAHRDFDQKMWVKIGRDGIEEYTEAEAENYVRREFRPEVVGAVKAIALFLG